MVYITMSLCALPTFQTISITSITSIRVSVRKALGFETFVEESLDDHCNLYAFLVPDSVDRTTAESVRDVVQVCFTNAGLRCESVQWFDEKTYEYNWCGSRHLTVHLDKHWQFKVVSDEATSLPIPPKPACDPWLVVSANYDEIKSENSFIRYDATYMTAATSETYMNVLHTIRTYVGDSIQRIETLDSV
jgi:hypothetical protein